MVHYFGYEKLEDWEKELCWPHPKYTDLGLGDCTGGAKCCEDKTCLWGGGNCQDPADCAFDMDCGPYVTYVILCKKSVPKKTNKMTTRKNPHP